jgi:plastocyanin
MRPRRPGRLPVLIGLAAASLAAGASALAAAGKAPSSAKIAIKGGETFKPNAYDKDSSRFVPGTVTVRSGATIALTNVGAEPHSLSLVAASAVPHTISQLNNCAICVRISLTHGVNPMAGPVSGPPPKPVVDVGAPGFDAPGDSVIVGPKGSPLAKATFKVTAKAGTTLHFICIIHPWMLGRILVK